MIGNDEPGCLSVMWQIMSWWLITKSHSASTRGTIVMQTEGGKGISQDFFTQSAGRKWWSCFWLSRCSSCRDKPRYPAAASERSYKKTTSISLSEIRRQKKKRKTKKKQRTQALHYMGVKESALLNSGICGGQMMLYWMGRLFFLWPPFSHKLWMVSGAACFWCWLLIIHL